MRSFPLALSAWVFALPLTLALLAPGAGAYEIHVEKVSGSRAIVSFPKEAGFEAGKNYRIEEGDDSASSTASAPDDGKTRSGRKVHLDLSASFVSLKTSTKLGSAQADGGSTTTTAITFVGRAGWNLGILEFGPLMSFSSSRLQSVTTSAFLLGVFADFNFIRNKVGNNVIPGISLDVGLESAKSAGADGSSGIAADLSFFLKCYVFGGQQTALRFDLGGNYTRVSNSAILTSATGPFFRAGLAFYF